MLVEYSYSPWGELRSFGANGTTATVLEGYNALKYRGYYQDEETGFYYLQSRYYDPVIGILINAAGYTTTGCGFLGYNMYTYCLNNPVNLIDHLGIRPWYYEDGSTKSAYNGARPRSSGNAGNNQKNVSLPYRSAEEAAKAFAKEMYSTSQYIRHEYGTEIYSKRGRKKSCVYGK